jgi:hypothetical protein
LEADQRKPSAPSSRIPGAKQIQTLGFAYAQGAKKAFLALQAVKLALNTYEVPFFQQMAPAK